MLLVGKSIFYIYVYTQVYIYIPSVCVCHLLIGIKCRRREASIVFAGTSRLLYSTQNKPIKPFFYPLLKISLRNPYLKILDLAKLFVVDSPMKKTYLRPPDL